MPCADSVLKKICSMIKCLGELSPAILPQTSPMVAWMHHFIFSILAGLRG